MNKSKINLQQFADRYGLQPKNYYTIEGPRGEITQAYAGWFYFQRGIGYHKFNPITQAQKAIEAIGLKYAAPPKPIKTDRRAFFIVEKTDGWHVGDKLGPFKTRELARNARGSLKNDQKEKPSKAI